MGITFYSVIFSKACPDIIYADFPILQKGCHNIVNIVTFLRCRNVAIMLWRCFITTFCGNIVATFLKLSWNMLQQLNVPTFSQLSPNVVETVLQPYCVRWDCPEPVGRNDQASPALSDNSHCVMIYHDVECVLYIMLCF